METKFATTVEEIEAINRLRYQIYVEEMGMQLDACHEEKLVSDPDDAQARLLYVEDEGQLVGTLRLQWGQEAPFGPQTEANFELQRFRAVVLDEKMVVITRLMVLPEYRSSPAALLLFARVIEFLLEHQVQLVFCDCQPHMLNLYARLGFRTYKSTINEPYAGLVVPLVGVVEDRAYMEQIGSPLLMFYGDRIFDPEVSRRLARLLPKQPPVRAISGEEETSRWTAAFGEMAQKVRAHPNVFHNLSEEEMASLIKHSNVIETKLHDLVIRRGMGDRTMFVILAGIAEIRLEEQVLDIASEGDVIGEIAFLLKGKRTADVYAASEGMRILALSEGNIKRLMEKEPVVAAKLFFNLSKALCVKLTTLHGKL